MHLLRRNVIHAIALCLTGQLFAANLISNGSFETNGGAGSSSFTGWTVVTQTGGQGNWFAQNGTTAPLNAFTVAAPSVGSFAAMTDSTGPTSSALLQTFTVPALGAVRLSFQYFRLNADQNLNYFVPPTLDFNTLDETGSGQPNQQARVDILKLGATAFDAGTGVVTNAFQTKAGEPLMDSGYQTVSMDLSPAIGNGGTFQLRFAVVNDDGQFVFGVDNVTVNFAANVSAQVRVKQTGFALNRVTGIWAATMTLTNTSGAAINGPIQVVLTQLTPGVTMVNSSGMQGVSPFITVAAGPLAPGASASVSIQFTNPSNGLINFTPLTYSGTF